MHYWTGAVDIWGKSLGEKSITPDPFGIPFLGRIIDMHIVGNVKFHIRFALTKSLSTLSLKRNAPMFRKGGIL